MMSPSDHKQTAPWIPPEAPCPLRSLFYEHATLITVRKGEKVIHRNRFHQHPYQHSLIFLRQGLLGRSKSTSNINKQLISTLLLPNRVYGPSSCLLDTNDEDTLVALRKSQIMILSPKRLQECLSNSPDPKLRKAINDYFLNCLESEHRGMFIIATEETQGRLAKLFKSLIYATDGKDQGDRYEVPIRLSNEELRKLVYTTKKTINTILPGWKRKGLYFQKEQATVISKSII